MNYHEIIRLAREWASLNKEVSDYLFRLIGIIK
jgi:hypothetical protein